MYKMSDGRIEVPQTDKQREKLFNDLSNVCAEVLSAIATLEYIATKVTGDKAVRTKCIACSLKNLVESISSRKTTQSNIDEEISKSITYHIENFLINNATEDTSFNDINAYVKKQIQWIDGKLQYMDVNNTQSKVPLATRNSLEYRLNKRFPEGYSLVLNISSINSASTTCIPYAELYDAIGEKYPGYEGAVLQDALLWSYYVFLVSLTTMCVIQERIDGKSRDTFVKSSKVDTACRSMLKSKLALYDELSKDYRLAYIDKNDVKKMISGATKSGSISDAITVIKDSIGGKTDPSNIMNMLPTLLENFKI